MKSTVYKTLYWYSVKHVQVVTAKPMARSWVVTLVGRLRLKNSNLIL